MSAPSPEQSFPHYQSLSIRMAQWLTTAGEIEEIVDDIDKAAMHAPDVGDDEYEALCQLRHCAELALAGWSKADAALPELPLARHSR